MKVIDQGQSHPTLEEVMGLAADELVVLRKPDGSAYAVSPVDDFAVEVATLRHKPEFMALLRQLSEEQPAISLEDLRKELAS